MIYRLRDIEIDLAQFELRVDQKIVQVEPKVFDLIVYLIQHRQRLVTREELFQTVWSGREVSDTTLSNHIKSARKVLGDNGNLQQIIKTVRSRGYQFIADVEECAKAEVHTASTTLTNDSTTSVSEIAGVNRARKLPLSLSKLIILLTAIICALWFYNATKTAKELPPYLLVVPFSVSSLHNANLAPFADQITRELIQSLRKISGIKIIPPPSSFMFKDNKQRSHIREKLPEVNFVLDGVISEGRNGNIRVTVELENLQNDKLLWDGDFDIQLQSTNRFNFQSKIASSVSKSLKVIILDKERQVLKQIPTSNVQAYELYVQGQHQFSLMTHESVLASIDLFSQAIAKDNTFEAAYIAKANAYRVIMILFDQPKKVLPKVISSAIDVLEINPESAKIMSLLGIAYVHAWQWEDAWKMLTKAHDKDPTLALTELGFALYYAAIGDAKQVKQALLNAERLDPLNLEIADWGLWALLMVNEVDAAIVWGKDKVKLHHPLPYPVVNLSVAEYVAGNFERSVQLAEQGVKLSQREVFPLIILAQSYAAAGNREKALALIKEAESAQQYMCPYETAVVHVLLGEVNKAFTLFEEAVNFQSNCLIFTRNDPRLASLKNDERYNQLLTVLALDDASISRLKTAR
ncbi:winged helix-turn-helix domain-containing protein [Thalassotalea sp. 1_MG-2023]|uniref:winged helix-turn-helix domain-containing protein n=1 Tax=Thalassotalea sp. 1_MG-2023 TaxID=3062680 RepID=UPI0026E387B6|nr:winged helix-turn-helix domain-containing protein [Thalassotalea sp. 1_MG-2023]MDO6426128.1 winged helix-turn-helix domain-containing protein [Thalassotalea sp. 1_MG-2023]